MGAGVRDVDVRQWEDGVVGSSGRLGGIAVEEARDERTLVEHVALRRAAEQPLASVAECGGNHVLLAAVDICAVGSEDLAPGRPGLLDFSRGPFLLALPPVVIDRCSGLAQDNLLVPVASRPAGGRLALQGHTPRLATVGLDLVLEGHQLVPGLGHLVALRLERLGVVPDQSLERRPSVERIQLVVDLPQVDPVRPVVCVELTHVELVVERDELARPGQLDERADAGGSGDVGRVAGSNLGLEDGIEVTSGLERDLDAGLIRERLHHGIERVFFGAGPGSQNVNGAANLSR